MCIINIVNVIYDFHFGQKTIPALIITKVLSKFLKENNEKAS